MMAWHQQMATGPTHRGPFEGVIKGLGFPKLGVFFGGLQNKDYSILGSILGPPPQQGKLPHRAPYR